MAMLFCGCGDDGRYTMNTDLGQTYPHLSKAPITEALFDFQVELPSSVTIESLAKFQSSAKYNFGERRERQTVRSKIEVQAGSNPRFVEPSFTPDGYVFTAHAERLVAQVRLDGFSLSRLPPYHDGATFTEQTRDLWQRYVDVASPTRVTQLVVRNINNLELQPGAELERYVLTGPAIARALPQTLANFFMQVTLPDPSGAVVVVTETFGEFKPESQIIPLIFDIAAIKRVSFDPGDPQIWSVLSELRALKNKFFFNSLTFQALEQYK
jgi:uncharacterized protein (TIGR04255 family)